MYLRRKAFLQQSGRRGAILNWKQNYPQFEWTSNPGAASTRLALERVVDSGAITGCALAEFRSAHREGPVCVATPAAEALRPGETIGKSGSPGQDAVERFSVTVRRVGSGAPLPA